MLTRQAHRNMVDARNKTSFVSNVSHELKTPLTSIRMYAELLSENRIKTPEKQKQYLDVIVSESQRLTRLVNNVLDFSRLEQERKQFQLEVIELGEHLQNLIEANRLRIQEAGIRIITELPKTLIKIKADRDAIDQIFLNLVENVIKYAAKGKELMIELAMNESNALLIISDRGQGIPVEHRRAIFEKFYRIDDSLTTEKPGSGLGLTIAQKLAQGLQGTLRFEPRKGSGSSFILELPLVDN